MTLVTATKLERAAIRTVVLRDGKALIPLERGEDGLWFVDLGGIIFEGNTAAEALRYLAGILEET